MNSEEAEKLVWAAQTIFATGCERPQKPPSTADPVTECCTATVDPSGTVGDLRGLSVMCPYLIVLFVACW